MSRSKASCSSATPRKSRRSEQGFILPLAVFLVIFIAISGTSFMQLDFLERRMAMNEIGNQGAFYLASAGIERERETFKIPSGNTWTTVLDGTAPGYTLEIPGDPVLCDPTKNCVIPLFGVSVTAASTPNFPFDLTSFNRGSYQARAFNDDAPGETSTVDANQILIFRARGAILGEQKVIEVTAKATAQLPGVACQGAATEKCPDKDIDKVTFNYIDGHDMASFPNTAYPGYFESFLSVPTPIFTYYATQTNFTGPSSPIQTSSCTWNGISAIASGCYYNVGDLDINSPGPCTSVGACHDIVIYSTGNVNVKVAPGVLILTNAILISEGGVKLRGGIDISAPRPLPAVISGDKFGGKDADGNPVVIRGTLYVDGGLKDASFDAVHGMVIGSGKINLKDGLYTDDGNPAYYDLMPGFTYPPQTLSTRVLSNSWLELQ